MHFFKKKTFESVREGGANSGLAKTLTAFDLIMLGLGGIIGTGVFVTTGLVAAQHSGPAVMISYAIAGLACIFVALAYTELAAMLPTSGSVYTYSYVAFGEGFAWLMGAVMILELALAAGGVAIGWSGYIVGLLKAGGINIPEIYTSSPINGGVANFPAMLIVAFVTLILYRGTKESKKLNAVLVIIKMVAIGVFVFVAAPHFDATNWDNFMPFGFDDVLIGSSILFFAFCGFGALATAAEECKNPKRDLMIGIIGSLILATIVYVIVGGLATGITSYENLNNAQPLAHALMINGSNFGSVIVAVGAVCGMTTVVMMNVYAQSRIFYAMARDGLLPKAFSKVHPKYDSPHIAIFVVSLFVAFVASFFPIDIIFKLSSMGSLIDYAVIMFIVMLFRVKMPAAQRSFKCPVIFVIAPTGLAACVYLLSKQIIGKDGSLMLVGQMLIYWFGFMFAVYCIRALALKVSRKKA